jgi:hypothetical protein
METNEAIKIQENVSPTDNLTNSEEESKEQIPSLQSPIQSPEFVAMTSSRSRNSE